ncbi:sodium:proton antiporter, partial [Staphylococcus hominis]
TLLAQQQTFTYKNDLLFIASLMVIISLVMAQIVLPLITPSEQRKASTSMSYVAAKVLIVQNVIKHFKVKSKEDESINYNTVISE